MKYLVILLLLVNNFASSQILTKKDIAPLALTFFAGMCDGTAEASYYHFDKMQDKYFHLNERWWNGKISHQNKYKNFDPQQGPAYFGSTTFLCWTTDAYHAFRMGRNVSMSVAIVLKVGEIRKQKWWYYPLQAVIYWFTYTLGFSFSYDWIWG